MLEVYGHVHLTMTALPTASGKRTLLRKGTPGLGGAHKGSSAEQGEDPGLGGGWEALDQQ